MRISSLFLLLALALLVLTVPVHAMDQLDSNHDSNSDNPTLIHFTVNSGEATIISSRTIEGITYITFRQSLEFTGDMKGSSTQTISGVFQANGDYVIHGKGTFTGTVLDSQQGTLRYRFSGHGTSNPYSQQGHVVFGRGTDGLEGIQIRGPYQSSSQVVTNLTLMMSFDQE